MKSRLNLNNTDLLILKKIKSLPIFHKLMLCFTFFTLLISITYYANYSSYTNEKASNAINIVKQTNTNMLREIDGFISYIKNITILPAIMQTEQIVFDNIQDNNTETYETVSSVFFNGYEEFNNTNIVSYNFHKASTQLFNRINGYNYFTYTNHSQYIHSAFLYNLNGFSEREIFSRSLTKGNYINPKNEPWFKKCLDNYGSPTIIGPRIITNSDTENTTPLYVYSIGSAIVKVEGKKLMGILVIDSDMDFFSEICSEIVISPSQRFLIVDTNNIIIFDSHQEHMPTTSINKLLSVDYTKPQNISYENINGINSLVSYSTSNVTGIKVINIIPMNEFNQNINSMKRNSIMLSIVIFLVLTIIMYILSRRIIKPLNTLVILMKQVEQGNFDVRIAINSDDEIGKLSKAFNKMSKKIKTLIQVVYIDKIKQKELELQMLQNQINPHFLYNTLDSIHMMAEINNDTETSKMVRILGKLLRYSIHGSNSIVTVEEELANLQDYITLHKIRFSHIFEITMNVDPIIYNYKIIKLILQPIVENAINHGLKDKARNGQILIEGCLSEPNIIFTITDNGIGMDSYRLKALNDYINEINNDFDSIGLKNANKRIKLHYGDQYGLKIFSVVGEGTTVKVTILKSN